jgi:hypothetical protein
MGSICQTVTPKYFNVFLNDTAMDWTQPLIHIILRLWMFKSVAFTFKLDLILACDTDIMSNTFMQIFIVHLGMTEPMTVHDHLHIFYEKKSY